MRQRTFFDAEFDADQDAKRLARRSDPVTSHVAAEEMTRSGAIGAQRKRVLDALRAHGPATRCELEARSGIERHLCSKRFPELERQGLIIRGAARRCTVAGTMQIEWSVTQRITA